MGIAAHIHRSNSLIHAAAVTLALKSPPGSLKSQVGAQQHMHPELQGKSDMRCAIVV
jgi:hypothetical protein